MKIESKINYIFSVPDWAERKITSFQLYPLSIMNKIPALKLISLLPSEIGEFTPRASSYCLILRGAGQLSMSWHLASPRAITSQQFPLEEPFSFLVIGNEEEIEYYNRWKGSSKILEISHCSDFISNFTFLSFKEKMIDLCNNISQLYGKHILPNKEDIMTWSFESNHSLDIEFINHYSTYPGWATIRKSGFDIKKCRKERASYNEIIKQIIMFFDIIIKIRIENPPVIGDQNLPERPIITLYTPNILNKKIFNHFNRDNIKCAQTAYSRIQREIGFDFDFLGEKDSKHYKEINNFLEIRCKELELESAVIAILAASECSAVLTFPNKIRRILGAVRQFSEHYRAKNPNKKKRTLVFSRVQDSLLRNSPPEFISAISSSQGIIRIISDFHLEWLDINGLPLCLRYNTSRIPASPGPLILQCLSQGDNVFFEQKDLFDILIIRGLPVEDHIYILLQSAISVYGKLFSDKIRITFCDVKSKDDFIEAINNFEGKMIIFDGHGSHEEDGSGVIWLGDKPCNVMDLGKRIIRMPPIVILSACDTYAADRNHETTANAFLSLGCRSILSSVFPLNASDAATFCARLLYRIHSYIPPMLGMKNGPLSWTEIISGMLRRQFVSDFYFLLVEKKYLERSFTDNVLSKMSAVADISKNDYLIELREILLKEGVENSVFDIILKQAISETSAISYLNVGRPETVFIIK